MLRERLTYTTMNPSDAGIIRDHITRVQLAEMAEARFGDMVKAVVDVSRRVMAAGGELHSDEEAMLLDDGPSQHTAAATWRTKARARPSAG